MADIEKDFPMGWYASPVWTQTKSHPTDCRWCHGPLDITQKDFRVCEKCDGGAS